MLFIDISGFTPTKLGNGQFFANLNEGYLGYNVIIVENGKDD